MHKNKNKFAILAAILLVITAFSFTLSGCNSSQNKYDTQILKGFSEDSMFDYKDLLDMGADWNFTSGGIKSTVFSTGSNGISINTTTGGYANVSQLVLLKAYSYYKVEYDFNISQMSNFDENIDYYPGLFVGFKEDPLFNVIGDKKAQETTVQQNGHRTFYFNTGGTREYNLTINLGTENYPVKGIATVKSINLVRVTETAANQAKESGYDLFDLRSSVFGINKKTNNLYVVLGAIFTLILAYIAYILRSRDMAFNLNNRPSKNKLYNKLKESRIFGLAIVLGLALLVRVIILLVETLVAGAANVSLTYFGYYLENLSAQGTWIAKYGTPYFYQYNSNTQFMPVPLYLTAISGLIGQGISKVSGVSGSTVALVVVTVNKIFAIIADLISVFLVFKLIETYQGKTTATIMAGFFGLIPVLFAFSSAWGTVESIASMLILASFYCMLKKKYIGMVISFFIACLTSVFSIYLVPIIMFYTIYLIVDAIKKKKYKDIIAPCVAIVSGFILFYLITLPFSIIDIQKGSSLIAFNRYIAVIKGADLYTLNAFNFQALLKNNFVQVTIQSKVVDIIFVLFILLVFALVYFKTRNRLNLTLLGFGVLLALWTFSNNMKPEMLVLALPLLFLVAVILKETRLYVAFALYSAFAYINNAYVYLVAGYDKNGVSQISYDNNAILYVFGAFSLVLAIYFIIVGYDILVNKKVVEQKPITVSYLTYSKRIVKNVFISISNTATITNVWLKDFFRALKEDFIESKQKLSEKRQNKIQMNLPDAEKQEIEKPESEENPADIENKD